MSSKFVTHNSFFFANSLEMLVPDPIDTNIALKAPAKENQILVSKHLIEIQESVLPLHFDMH